MLTFFPPYTLVTLFISIRLSQSQLVKIEYLSLHTLPFPPLVSVLVYNTTFH